MIILVKHEGTQFSNDFNLYTSPTASALPFSSQKPYTKLKFKESSSVNVQYISNNKTQQIQMSLTGD
jgi:hypothetical protein